MKPRLLDLFCKAGGAGMGYHRVGFEVVGVDIEPQKNYPFEFHQAEALEFVGKYGREFDVIHASPPCQLYGRLKGLVTKHYEDLLEPTRAALLSTGRPFIIENLPQAALINPTYLCGTMFGLKVIRHRGFEIHPPLLILTPGRLHPLRGKVKSGDYISVAGHSYLAQSGREAMGIDWMIRDELSEAIPPAYTEFIGKQIIQTLGVAL